MRGALLAGLLARALVARWPYSGEAQPPRYGDYEAQRHWMEITTNLPAAQWYVHSKNNDLQYWGLDYPPLSAHFARLLGVIANKMHPQLVELHASRGHESPPTRAWMRNSVIASDAIVYAPAALLWARAWYRAPGAPRSLFLLLLLLSPPLLLVDHGHFQYNGVSLGLAALGALAAVNSRPLACCVLFSLSLNFKQMGLYFAPPFFCYLFAGCLRRPTYGDAAAALATLGCVTILTFALCWAPFLTSVSDAAAVLRRVFPVSRSLYEDKVANFWCTIALLPPLKLKQIWGVDALVRLSLATTIASVLPSSAMLLRWPSRRGFLVSMCASALAFFLFSFQVHEKHILLPLLPAMLLAPELPAASCWFAAVASFSMFPLLERDGLRVPYYVLQLALILVLAAFESAWPSGAARQLPTIWRRICAASVAGMVVLHAVEALFAPPARYPDLYAVVFSAYSSVHFGFGLCVLTYLQCRLVATEAVHTPLSRLERVKFD